MTGSWFKQKSYLNILVRQLGKSERGVHTLDGIKKLLKILLAVLIILELYRIFSLIFRDNTLTYFSMKSQILVILK